MNKYKRTIFLTLLFIIGAMTACGAATEKIANDKASGGTDTTESVSTGNKKTENKSVENKISEETAQKDSVEIYDGRANDYQESKSSDTEKAFVGKILDEKDAEIKNLFKDDEFECDCAGFIIEGVGKGAFTKPNSSQTAYVYRKCMNDTVKYPSFISGIIIAENDKVISHLVYGDIASFSTLKVLPDVNQNNLSELALTSSGATAEYTTLLEIYEFAPSGLVSLGTAKVYTNSSDEGEENGSETTYKISVRPAKSPVFFKETFHRKSDTEKWALKNKSEKFSMEKKEASEFKKID